MTAQIARRILISTITTLSTLLIMHACNGPQSLNTAIQPLDEQTYLGAVGGDDKTPREAFLHAKAAQTGQTYDQALVADLTLSTTKNPFDARHDSQAVSRGAVIYKYNCLSCHGSNADGRGPDATNPTDNMNFHRFSTRFAVTLHGGAPSKWFRIINDGTVSAETKNTDAPPQVMEPFRDVLAREQIWLVVTYLQSLGN